MTGNAQLFLFASPEFVQGSGGLANLVLPISLGTGTSAHILMFITMNKIIPFGAAVFTEACCSIGASTNAPIFALTPRTLSDGAGMFFSTILWIWGGQKWNFCHYKEVASTVRYEHVATDMYVPVARSPCPSSFRNS